MNAENAEEPEVYVYVCVFVVLSSMHDPCKSSLSPSPSLSLAPSYEHEVAHCALL